MKKTLLSILFAVVCAAMISTSAYAKPKNNADDEILIEVDDMLDGGEYVEITGDELTDDLSNYPKGTIKEFKEQNLNSGIATCASIYNVMIDWTIRPRVIAYHHYYYREKGSVMRVNLKIIPNDVSIRVGYIAPDKTIKYVLMRGTSSHNFLIPTSGQYRFYVHNISKKKVDLAGYYSRYEPKET